jgi:cell pole-organizing protein PopZ
MRLFCLGGAMRFLTAAIVAGAIALVAVVAVFVHLDQPTEVSVHVQGQDKGQGDGQGQGHADARNGSRQEAAGNGKRSARVQERLDRMHGNGDADPHRADAARPANRMASDSAVASMKNKNKDMARHAVGVPTASAALVPDDMDEDELKEFDELKTTLLTNPDPDERIGAVLMLTGTEGEAAWRLLADAMGDPDGEVRLAVVEALGDYSDDIPASLLTPALNDSDPEVRFEAYGILGDMESEEALTLVRNGMSDPDPEVRELVQGIVEFSDDGK